MNISVTYHVYEHSLGYNLERRREKKTYADIIMEIKGYTYLIHKIVI